MSEPTEPPIELQGTVAIVGFPNVGKSTLINRLTSTRQAVVHETQGTTRDRKELIAEWNGLNFLLIDTGGVDIVDPHPITRQIAQQARTAIAEADLVLFVVDARAGVTPGDEELAQILRESKKDVLLLANKIDDPSQASLALELHRLGFGDPFPISALHGSNTGDLLDEVLDRLPGVSSRVVPDDDAIRVAILGRPNVGKSSLLNKLLGEERAIVHDVPGTTRDTTDTVLEHNGRTFILVDTAGLRRKRKQRQGIDYYSELRALDAADRADVALVLIDSSEGIVEGDITAVEVARKSHSATLIVLAKWDISEITIEEVRPELQRRLRQRPDFITISSLTGRGVSRILDKVADLFDVYASRVPTAELNKFLGELKQARQPPSKGVRRLNMLYGAQVSSRPPRFRITVNDPGLITRDYGYWVENQLRERFELEGVPVAIDFRARTLNAVVVGGGAWGTAFTDLLRARGHDVTLATRATIDDAPYEDAELVVLAVPSSSFREVLGHVRGDAPVLSLVKGLDPASGDRLSTLVTDRPVAVLSGPNMAEEVAAGLPGATVIASEDESLAIWLQDAITSVTFRVYVNTDLIGVELCGAAKNVIALSAGGVDGLRLGDNAKAAMITRGLVEMARLGEACGAEPETFSGLAGMGDLICTCWHPSGRNRRAGELIARGSTPDEARAAIGQVVEGLNTAPVLRDLSHRIGVELPITEGVCAVLDGMQLDELLSSLMGRRATAE